MFPRERQQSLHRIAKIRASVRVLAYLGEKQTQLDAEEMAFVIGAAPQFASAKLFGLASGKPGLDVYLKT